ncbi:SMP-30/gluconolactonase/LRE family protein [Polyangium sp. y55x31]|uniref:SMP-30/gluconolactonase/LRE family protein n=1 Tax=Polyangium sp. y55x31 TaxID=3042688 RepID=UPI0024830402|nr:SMP-30/gluconolactonase/LRE family protein [Polyangium sp. y55x31]MDI1479340.1 SMP-30/gluconolactonase/LRE family protein [Polyangium sp. y55x31]
MHSRPLSIAILSFLVSTSALVAGCSYDPAPASTQSSSSSSSSGSGGSGGAGGAGGNGGNGGGGGSSSAPEVVAAFDPMKGEYVEGLDVKDGVAYVGAVLTGQILKVDLATGAISPFGAMPAFPQNGGALVGLTLGPDGAVYGALNITAQGGPQTGIYRVPAAGGEAMLFASDPAMAFNNDLRFTEAGDLLVSDSMSGTIFKVTKDGTVSKWLEDMLLTPDPAICGVQTNFHLGINGFVRAGDAYYATNTDRASIVKIPVNADGSAGQPEVFLATDCATLSGADGIAVDPSTGDLIVAVNYKETIIRVGMDKTVKSIASGEPLQSPASLVVDDGNLYITNAAFAALASDPSKAKPSLAKLVLP